MYVILLDRHGVLSPAPDDLGIYQNEEDLKNGILSVAHILAFDDGFVSIEECQNDKETIDLEDQICVVELSQKYNEIYIRNLIKEKIFEEAADDYALYLKLKARFES